MGTNERGERREVQGRTVPAVQPRHSLLGEITAGLVPGPHLHINLLSSHSQSSTGLLILSNSCNYHPIVLVSSSSSNILFSISLLYFFVNVYSLYCVYDFFWKISEILETAHGVSFKRSAM